MLLISLERTTVMRFCGERIWIAQGVQGSLWACLENRPHCVAMRGQYCRLISVGHSTLAGPTTQRAEADHVVWLKFISTASCVPTALNTGCGNHFSSFFSSQLPQSLPALLNPKICPIPRDFSTPCPQLWNYFPTLSSCYLVWVCHWFSTRIWLIHNTDVPKFFVNRILSDSIIFSWKHQANKNI